MTRLAVISAAAIVFTGAASFQAGSAGQAQPAPKRPSFTDIASKSVFSYKSNNDYKGDKDRKFFPQPMCGGVAVFDYDNDGLMDIFFTNGAKMPDLKKTDPSFYSCLLRNKGDGTFEDVTVKAGLTGEQMDFSYGVAIGDYDNDGHEDIFICNTGKNTLYHNNGNGTFTDVTAESGIGGKPDYTISVVAAWFDYDRDGLLDLVVSNYTFWSPVQCGPGVTGPCDYKCEMGDKKFYCDPRRYKSVPHRLYHNLGGGKFKDVTRESGFEKAPGKGMGISIADFNRDGLLDVFVANDTDPNSLFMNMGKKPCESRPGEECWTFDEQGLPLGVAYDDNATSVSSMGCDAGDFDNDGKIDIFYNNLMGQIWALFHNMGDAFRYHSPLSGIRRLSAKRSGWSNGFIDYNNDGWPDIYSSNGDVDYVAADSAQHDTMFENVEGKTFTDVSQEMGQDFLHVGYQRGSAFGDLNNDGFMDLVVTSLNERPRILMNSGGNGNHWIKLDLRGRYSDRDAIGAGVKVTTASGRVIYKHVAVSVGFMSSSDKRVHVGLGAEAAVKSVEITWPRGTTQTLADVKVDRITRIEEPK